MIADTRLFLKIDETGSPGKRVRGKTHYLMVGCLIGNNYGFENITERYGYDHELKFHDLPWLRDEILTDAEPFLKAVYYVQFSKRKHNWTGTGDKHKLHKDMLYSLIYGIARNIRVDNLDVVIDHNTIIDDNEARNLVREVCTEMGIRVNPLVGDSVSDYGLQTNDFFAGAIGYMFNTPANENKGIPLNHYVCFFEHKMRELPFREYKKSGGKR